MDDVMRCPGCDASLTLPSIAAGQPVQCPRCQNIIEAHIVGSSHMGPVVVPSPDVCDGDDDQRAICLPDPIFNKSQSICAITLLGICMISFGVQSYISFKEAQLAKEGWHIPFRQEADGGREDELHNFAVRSYGYHDLILGAAVVFFLIWLWQARRNLAVLQVDGLSHRPLSALLAFFIPIVNFYWPYVILQEIWRASHPRAVSDPRAWMETPPTSCIRWWWFFSIIGALPLVLSVVWYDPNLFPNLLGDQKVRALQFPIACILCVANVCMIAAAGLLVVTIMGISRRQRLRYINLYEDPV